MRCPVILAVLVALTAGIAAQGTPSVPSFDAASIKRNRSPEGPGVVAIRGNTLIAPFITARALIRAAYGVRDDQILGGPAWLENDRFEITAAIPAGSASDDIRSMLRSLLSDRFGLSTHHEMRPLPVYVLTFARSDRRLGDGLRPSGPTCAPMIPPAGVPPPPPPPPARGGGAPAQLLDWPRLRCPSMFGPGFVSARGISVSTLALQIRTFVSRPIVDRTGLSGDFDVDLTYAPEVAVTFGGPPILASDAPSLFTAFQEQLGLKLESAREPFDVLVIDRVAPPTED